MNKSDKPQIFKDFNDNVIYSVTESKSRKAVTLLKYIATQKYEYQNRDACKIISKIFDTLTRNGVESKYQFSFNPWNIIVEEKEDEIIDISL